MGLGYGISGIGNYASDPYFNYAYGSYNPNFMAAQTAAAQVAAQQAAAQTGASASGSTQTVTNPASDVTFQGSEKESSSSGIVTGLLVGGTVAAGAATMLYALKKGNGAGIKAGFKNIWNSLKGKASKAADKADDVASKISNLIKDGGKNLKSCKIKNGSDDVIIKNGSVSEVVTKAESKVKNLSGVSVPSGINPKSKDVTLASIERTIKHNGKDYKVVLDKEGNVIEAFLGKKKVDAGEVEGLVDKAQTYTHNFTGRKVHLKDRSGNYREYTKEVELSVRNGDVVSARYKDGGSWVDIADETTLSKLKDNFQTEIPKFGKANKGFGLTPQECIYEYTGANRRYLFNGNRKVTEAFDIKSTSLTSPKKVADYLEKNGIQDIAKTGNLPDGAKIADAVYHSEAGNIYTIKNGKVESVKLKDGCTFKTKKGKSQTYRSGQVISGTDLQTWQQGLAANNTEFNAIKDML